MNDAQIIKLLVIWVTVIVAGVFVGYYLSASPQMITIVVVGGAVLAFVAFRGMNTKGMSQLETMYYIGFAGVLALVWSPLKAAAYGSPMFFMGFFILLMSVGRNSLILMRTMLVLGGWFLLSLAYKGLNVDFVDQNALVALATYSSIVPLLVVPTRSLARIRVFHRMMKIVVMVALIEFCLGIFQGLWGLLIRGGVLWDYVEGTMHISLAPSGALDSIMFACNTACILLAMIAYSSSSEKSLWYVYVLGVVALVLGSVMHLLMSVVLAVAIALAVFRPIRGRDMKRRAGVVLIIGAVATPALFLTVFQDRLQSVPVIVGRMLNNQNPKTRIVVRSLQGTKDRYPLVRTFGLGPGQNGSRACLISAGYLGNLPKPLKVRLAPVFAEFGLEQWIAYFRNPYGSASNRPASSWGAIILEFGFFGFFMIPLWLAYLILKLYRAVGKGAPRMMAFSAGATIILLYGLGAVELYWEVPQAIFAPLLLLKVMYANVLYGAEADRRTDLGESATADPEPVRAAPRPIRSPVLSGGLGSMR